jgi:hypothetical protein
MKEDTKEEKKKNSTFSPPQQHALILFNHTKMKLQFIPQTHHHLLRQPLCRHIQLQITTYPTKTVADGRFSLFNVFVVVFNFVLGLGSGLGLKDELLSSDENRRI